MNDKPQDVGKTNPRVQEKTGDAVTKQPRKATMYGKHATMPVLAADQYAEVILPNLTEFNPESIKLDGTVVAVGKRRTGKSWVFRNLMYLMRDKIPAGIVISQTDELNKFWRQYIPAKYIYPKYEPEILDAVFRRQKKILNDKGLTDKEKDEKAPFFVLLDDVISDQRLKYDANLMELFVAGRHYRLFVLITTQYAKAITPTLRGNTDYCFIMKTIQQMQREALWNDFGDFLTKDAFAQILDAYTEDNEVLVIDTCPEHTADPLEMLYWWKAQDPGKFQIGSKDYWQSAMNDNAVPPKEGPESALDLLTVKDFMPHPWSQMI
tara:strand:- start:5552 stop:6517 length:966 start_codon:yes stop_codon:yes gene_type:complete